MPAGLYFSPLSYQIDTLAEAGDDANWITDIVAGSVTFIHGVQEVENLTEEDLVYTATSQKKTFMLPGLISLKFSVNASVDQHKALKTYNGKSGRMGFYDKANNILGTSPDGTIFKGYKMSYIRVSDLIIPTDATPAFTIIEVQFANNAELNETLHVIRPYKGAAADNWYPFDLPNLSQVLVTQVGTIATNEVVFDVSVYAPSDTDNAGDPVAAGAIEGLDVTTFLNTRFTDGAGVILTPLTMVESTTIPGRYTATFTVIVAGSDVEILPTTDQVFTSVITTFA
jgi:hypothetical protein